MGTVCVTKVSVCVLLDSLEMTVLNLIFARPIQWGFPVPVMENATEPFVLVTRASEDRHVASNTHVTPTAMTVGCVVVSLTSCVPVTRATLALAAN
jgi:hypothetical protein